MQGRCCDASSRECKCAWLSALHWFKSTLEPKERRSFRVPEVQNAIGVEQGIKLIADGAAPRIAQIDGKISTEHGVKGTAFQFN